MNAAEQLAVLPAFRGAVARAIAVVLVLAVGAAGCASIEDNPKTAIGGLGGAAAGGLLAAAVGGGGAGIAAGVILGGLAGGLVGNLLDQRDKQLQAQATQRALETAPSGSSTPWRNPDSGHSGTVTPVRTYQSQGQYCREYQQTVTIDGKQEKGYGTACRQPDGAWKIVS